MTSHSRRFRVQVAEAEYRRLELLASRSGLTVMREAVLLLMQGVRIAERRWREIDGEALSGYPHPERIPNETGGTR
jgi:hypothetical protein